MTADTNTPTMRRKRRQRAPKGSRSDYEAFGVYGVKHKDAMKAAADALRELERRMASVKRFLDMGEAEYNALNDAGDDRTGIEKLKEIREYFNGELEIVCRVLKLDVVDVGELAARYEFDGGYSRKMSEIMAVRDFLQHARRYDGEVKEWVESGIVFDAARSYLDHLNYAREA